MRGIPLRSSPKWGSVKIKPSNFDCLNFWTHVSFTNVYIFPYRLKRGCPSKISYDKNVKVLPSLNLQNHKTTRQNFKYFYSPNFIDSWLNGKISNKPKDTAKDTKSNIVHRGTKLRSSVWTPCILWLVKCILSVIDLKQKYVH